MLASEMKVGEVVCYEEPDDASLISADGTLRLFQVKQTTVSKGDVYQIYINWVIAALESEMPITEYVLLQSKKYKCSPTFVDISRVDFLAEINKRASEKPGCLASRLLSMADGDLNSILKVFDGIKSKSKHESILNRDLDSRLRAGLTESFDTGDGNSSVFDDRIAEFQRVVSYNIHEAMSRNMSYKLTFQGRLKLCEGIRDRITAEKYNPNYLAWRAACDSNSIDVYKARRECRQLEYCISDSKRITEHLFYRAFYGSTRFWYLDNSKAEIVGSIEDVTYENFCNVVEELKEDGCDRPLKRLRETKALSNSFTNSEFERWGSCIFLTGSDIPSDHRISWKVEDDKNNDI